MSDKSYDLSLDLADEFQGTLLLLSQFIIEWNRCEERYTRILASYVGEHGMSYATVLGNQSRTDALKSISESSDTSKECKEAIEFSITAFSLLKNNRNSLAHSYGVQRLEQFDKPRWLRQPRNPKSYMVYCLADEKDVRENLEKAKKLTEFLQYLLLHLMVHHKGFENFKDEDYESFSPFPLLPIFELPAHLTPHAVPRKEQAPPPQS